MGQLGCTILLLIGASAALGQGASSPAAASPGCPTTKQAQREVAEAHQKPTLPATKPQNAQVAKDPEGPCPEPSSPGIVNKLLSTKDLPHAPSSYVPLTSRQKFQLFLRTTYSPYTFESAAFNASLAQAEGQWSGYGGGIQGWGKRFGATLADTEGRKFIQTYLLSSLLHQDPRYFPSHKEGVVPRGWYAVTRVMVTRSDNGSTGFNSSEILGVLLVSSLQNAYYPRRDRGFLDTVGRFTGALTSDATSDILREFWPDIRQLFRKHAPEKIKKIEEKIPDGITDTAPDEH